MDGPRLFLRYAWPCADIRLLHRLIDQKDYATLERHIEHSLPPSEELLARCFPNATAGLLQHARQNDLEPWSLQNVSEFWHTHQGDHPACAVQEAIVFELLSKGKVSLHMPSGTQIIAKNPYNLALRNGNRVYLHRLAIVELTPPLTFP